jgi:hypothetical protein
LSKDVAIPPLDLSLELFDFLGAGRGAPGGVDAASGFREANQGD